MSNLRQAAEQALEACADVVNGWESLAPLAVRSAASESLDNLRTALAEPEQEPVAWKETDEVECPVCKDKGFPWPKCGHITYLERTPSQQTETVFDCPRCGHCCPERKPPPTNTLTDWDGTNNTAS